MKTYDAVRLILTHSLSDRQIGAMLNLSKTTVGRYRQRLREHQYDWLTLSKMTPNHLRQLLLYGKRGPKGKKRQPNLAEIQAELAKPGVTRQLLWEEYRADSPRETLSYPQFTEVIRKYLKRLPSVMRQTHVPGERVFVDYSGKRPHYINPTTGARVDVELFVGVLGASSYLYATCTHSQKVPDWIAAHVSMLEFFGGVPRIVVPDNLKSAVTKPGAEPVLQQTYKDFARHYGMAILPARPYRPKDKGKVEVGVKIAQRWLVARLRNRHFYSLGDLNNAIASLLTDVNSRRFKRFDTCRRKRFEELDRPKLMPLPSTPYVLSDYVSKQTVPTDYHVLIHGHFYSVPHALVGEKVEGRVTCDAVQILHNHAVVASHARSDLQGQHTTVRDHQPANHRAEGDRTPEHMRAWAKQVGPSTLVFVNAQFDRSTPTLGLPACSALRRLGETHGAKILESATQRALELNSPTITALKGILRTGLHTQTVDPFAKQERRQLSVPPSTARGADYYQGAAP